MKRVLFVIMLSVVGLSYEGISQENKTESVVDVLGYDPQMILDDWKSWEEKQTNQNEFIADFMTDYEVPQTGLYGFDLHNTWIWWIQTNKEAIERYLELKEENGLE